MNTSTNQQRGTRSQRGRLVLPVVATCALSFLVGCGGTSDGDSGGSIAQSNVNINSLAPQTGPPGGGTLVTITGDGFLDGVVGATTVTFGGVAAGSVNVLDDNTLQATSPAGAADLTVDVRVENSRGTATLGNGFLYLATAVLVSDLNSDGVPDMVIAASKDDSAATNAGAVYVFYGASEGQVMIDSLTSAADVVVRGNVENDRLGSAVVTGDVNSDGHHDLVIGVPLADTPVEDAGQVAIFLGPLGDNLSLTAADADIVLTGEGTVAGAWYGVMGDEFGAALSLGDRNGDAVLDLLVGAPGVDLNAGQPDELEDAGRAYVFLGGGLLATADATMADEVIDGLKKSDELGFEVCMVDLDADGNADVAASYDVALSGANHRGRVAVFTRPVTQATASDADVTLSSDEDDDRFGFSLICGDFNGDGLEDLFVGAPYSNALGSVTGRVYAFAGNNGVQSMDASAADVVISGQLTGTGFGSELASADVNGDGYGDLLVGAPFATASATWDGQVFVFYGGENAADTVAFAADVVLSGEPLPGERFGSAIEVLDCDADGIADIMTSAAGHGSLSGRVHVFHGDEGLADTYAESDDLTLTGESEGGSFGSAISRGK